MCIVQFRNIVRDRKETSQNESSENPVERGPGPAPLAK